MDIDQLLVQATQSAFARLNHLGGEDAFQAALAAVLGSCERELRCAFSPPSRAAVRPPQSAIDILAAKKTPLKLPVEGRDPCAALAKLDILWHSMVGPVPIELKYCANWKADTNGYQFLKDLHRLERMKSAGQYGSLSDVRYAVFATCEAAYWRGERPEPKPFWLAEGRCLEAGYWVQYDQKSPDTLWYSYPPFFLANTYTFSWRDLPDGWKYLLVRVAPQVGETQVGIITPVV